MSMSSKTDRTAYNPEPAGENVPPPKQPDKDDPFTDTRAFKERKKILGVKTTNVPPRRSAARQAGGVPPPAPTIPHPARQVGGVAPPAPTIPRPARQDDRVRGRMFRPAAAAAPAVKEEEEVFPSSPPVLAPSAPVAPPPAVRTRHVRGKKPRPATAVPADEDPAISPPATAAEVSITSRKRVITDGDVDAVIDAGRTPLVVIPSSPPVPSGNAADEDAFMSTPVRRGLLPVRLMGRDTDELTLPDGRYVVSYDGEDTVATQAAPDKGAVVEKGKQRMQRKQGKREQKKHAMFSVSPVAQFTPRDGVRKRKRVEIFEENEQQQEEEEGEEDAESESTIAPPEDTTRASASTSMPEPAVAKKDRTLKLASVTINTASPAAAATKTAAKAVSSHVYGKRVKRAAPVETEAARKMFVFSED